MFNIIPESNAIIERTELDDQELQEIFITSDDSDDDPDYEYESDELSSNEAESEFSSLLESTHSLQSDSDTDFSLTESPISSPHSSRNTSENKTPISSKRASRNTSENKTPLSARNLNINSQYLYLGKLCYICSSKFENLDKQDYWISCETSSCQNWICGGCLPRSFKYTDDYFCFFCKK